MFASHRNRPTLSAFLTPSSVRELARFLARFQFRRHELFARTRVTGKSKLLSLAVHLVDLAATAVDLHAVHLAVAVLAAAAVL